MAQIPKLSDNLDIIAGLGDNPNTDDGLSSAELKAQFDRAPKIIQQFINTYVVPALNSYIVQTGFLPLIGGTMTGDIAMSGKKITGLANPADKQDAVTKAFIDALFPLAIESGGTKATTAEEARRNLGAAPAQHAHTMQDIAGGVIPMTGGGTGAQNGADGLAALFADGYWRISEKQLIASPDEAPEDAPDWSVFLYPMED